MEIDCLEQHMNMKEYELKPHNINWYVGLRFVKEMILLMLFTHA